MHRTFPRPSASSVRVECIPDIHEATVRLTEFFIGKRVQPSTLLVGLLMLVGSEELEKRTGCTHFAQRDLAKGAHVAQTTVQNSLRELERYGLIRREPPENPGDVWTIRWLTPIAERVLKTASTPRRTPIWLRGGIPAAASDSAEPESSVRLRELEPVAPAAAAALWQQIESHDVRTLWIEVYAAWRVRVLQIHAKPRDPSPATWGVLAQYAALFDGAEQRRALELTCQAWPEVASDKVKSVGYPLTWLEHDLAALEPRVRRALTLAAQREQRTERTTATSSPISPEERRQLARVALGAVGGGRAA